MRKVKRWKYYCEYCGKSGGHAGHMRNHESSCTANPFRHCNLCDIVQQSNPKMADMIRLIKKTARIKKDKDDWGLSITLENESEVMEAIRDIADNCPMCIMSALRQHGHPYLFESWDMKAEMKSFWNDYNLSQQGYY